MARKSIPKAPDNVIDFAAFKARHANGEKLCAPAAAKGVRPRFTVNDGRFMAWFWEQEEIFRLRGEPEPPLVDLIEKYKRLKGLA